MKHWRRELMAAATLAFAVLGLESLHLLTWLDAAMLRLIQGAAGGEHVALADVQVVTIDDETYARQFELRSPLSRAMLVQLVDEIAARRPAALVVDLQLEPGARDAGQATLDGRLMQLARDGTAVVLALPEAHGGAVDRDVLAWMVRLCAAGVRFGDARLLTHFGAVLRYERDTRLLARVVRRPAKTGSPTCTRLEEVSSLEQLELLTAAEPEPEAETTAKAHIPTPRLQPALLKPALLQRARANAIVWTGPRRGDFERIRPGQWVLLGGAYDARDRLATAAGEFSGVFVHAAILADDDPATESHALNVAIEIVAGTLLGLLFHRLWWSARCATVAMRRVARLRHWRPWVASVAEAYVAQGSAVFVWAVAVGLVYLLLLVSLAATGHGVWVNPGPLVGGMFLHALLVRQEMRARTAAPQVSALPVQVPFMLACLLLYLWSAHG